MWKVLILVVVLAVPILCGPIDAPKKKTAFQRIVEDMLKQKCKNVSGVEVDFDRNDRLHLEFENCARNAIDKKQLPRELVATFPSLSLESTANFSLSNQEKNHLVNLSRTYCPKVERFIGCKDILQPIYSECYDTDELLGQKVEKEIYVRLNNFFCKNESEQVISFIDGKVIECAMETRVEVAECYQNYVFSFLHVDKENPLFSLLPKADKLCREIDNLSRCAVPIFEQCELSQTAAELVKSLFTDLLTGTSCTNFINRISL